MKEERRAAAKQKRIQQVKHQRIFLAVISICIIVAAFIYIVASRSKTDEKESFKPNEAIEVSATTQEEGETRGEATEPVDMIKIEDQTEKDVEEEPVETLINRVKRVRKEAKKAEYPADVIELLSKNPETVDFVENYDLEKNSVPEKEIAELRKGKIPQLLQWDVRWGYAPYGTSVVAVCGCGPTCLSMVISGLTGDKSLTPAKIAKYGTEHNYITDENDTKWAFIAEAGKEWGVRCREKMLNEEELKKELKAGHPVICSVGPGYFTQNGHFIVLAGYKNGKVIVHDPFSQTNSDKRWEFEMFEDQIKAMWTYWIE